MQQQPSQPTSAAMSGNPDMNSADQGARNPANQRTQPNHAAENNAAGSAGEIAGEGGGFMENNRSAIFGTFGVLLLGAGGFAFWTRRQAALG
jgi:hypothetical protein